jgi:hypothetical protein
MKASLLCLLSFFILKIFCDDVPRQSLLFHAVTFPLKGQTGHGPYDISVGFNMSQVWPGGSQMVYILKYKSAASLPYHWYVTIDSDAGRNLVYNVSTSDPYHSTIFSPDPSNPVMYPNFNYYVELAGGIDGNGTFTTDASNIIFFQLWLDGQSYWKNDDMSYCPGYIYYYLEAQKDQSYAYNMTLQGQYWSVTFSDLWIRHGAWPVPNVIYDYWFNDMTQFEAPTPPVIMENIVQTDRWFFVFKCKVKQSVTNPYWQIGVYMDPTCKKSCFDTGGTCFSNAAIPYCSCSRWYKDGGATCTDLFAGDYTLMALAIFFGLSLIIYIILKVYRLTKHQSSDQFLVEREELLRSDS